MNIQKIKKKGFFLIFTILALFCLVNCGKDNDSPIEENNSKESISNENTSKELEALKKPIDLSALTFNEAQQKLIDIHIADFPKDTEVVEGKNAIDEKMENQQEEDLKKFILKREQRKVLQVKLYIVIFTHQVILKSILKME